MDKLHTIRTSYASYKKKHPKGVEQKTYVELCNAFNRFLIEKALDGYEVTLPGRMGYVHIAGRKQEIKRDEDGKVWGLAPDWVSTKKLWDSNPEAKKSKQLVYHTNDHTEGVRYKFFWSKKNIFLLNKGLYAFRLTREHKRAIHKRIKEGQEYLIKKEYYKIKK